VRRRGSTALQSLVLVLPALWVATRYRHTYYFYDEWSLIGRVTSTSGLRANFVNFNGHLWLFPSLLYRAQLSWFGLGNHALVWTAFCLSLLLLAVAMRWLLVELGVAGWVATMAAVVLSCFGIAAQNLTYEIQCAPNTAYGLGFLAAASGLRWRNGRGAATSGLLLLLSVGFDSSAALLMLVFVAPLLLVAWRSWACSLALAPAAVTAVLWYELAQRGPSYPGSFATSARFAATMLLTSAGGLAGGGAVVGGLVILVGATALGMAVRRRLMTSVLLASTAGALLAAGLTAVALAMTRTGVAADHLEDFNRYFQQVAVFVLLAFLPPLWSIAPRRSEPVLALGLLAAFCLNLPPLLDYREKFEALTSETRARVDTAREQLTRPCPAGSELRASTTPLGDLGPQVTVGLLQNLIARGALPPMHAKPPSVRVLTCSRVP
jgi:hypothetical protein